MRPKSMRSVFLIATILAAASAQAQEKEALNLPVSLDRIREELAREPRPSMLDRLDIRPHFRVTVEEDRPSFMELFSPDDFKAGPIPAGGLYAYEQQQRLSPNTPPLVTFDFLPVARGIVNAIRDARRARAAEAARTEVQRAMAEFCAAQPDGGTGVVGCASKQ